MKAEWKTMYAPYFQGEMLNLGCANNHEPGFVNLDANPDIHPDVLHDMESTPLPFESNRFDCVLGSHIFEHVHRFVPLMEDLHRIIKPGGFLVAVTPYGSSDNAWDNPHHVRCFTESTWCYFDQELYKTDGAGNGATQGYKGDFKVEQLILIPSPEFHDDPELEFKKRHWRNVIQEIHAVLRKV